MRVVAVEGPTKPGVSPHVATRQRQKWPWRQPCALREDTQHVVLPTVGRNPRATTASRTCSWVRVALRPTVCPCGSLSDPLTDKGDDFGMSDRIELQDVDYAGQTPEALRALAREPPAMALDPANR
jgi:hypothetical protein